MGAAIAVDLIKAPQFTLPGEAALAADLMAAFKPPENIKCFDKKHPRNLGIADYGSLAVQTSHEQLSMQMVC